MSAGPRAPLSLLPAEQLSAGRLHGLLPAVRGSGRLGVQLPGAAGGAAAAAEAGAGHQDVPGQLRLRPR